MSEKYSTHSRREESVGMPSELRMIGGSSAIFIFLWRAIWRKNHYHVTHCFSSCAVFAFLRCIYDSLYYGVVALSNIPSKCSERCRVPPLCYSGSALHFPFNNYSAIFPFGCTGECSRCMFLACMRIFRQHDSERRQKQFPQLIDKLEESDTEET